MEERTKLTPDEAVRIGATSLTRFGRIFFPKTFRQASPEFHEVIGAAFDNPDMRNVAIEVFRDGAKTTLIRVGLARRISYGTSRTVLVVSASQAHSIMTLRWIKRQVEHNKLWTNTFKIRKGSKWSDDHLEVYHEKFDCYITILALGITGQLRGYNIDDHRPDLIICDDTSTDEAANSAGQRAKEQNLVFGALLNSLAPRSECPNAKAIILDTPKSKFDLIEGCEKDPEWHFFRYGIFGPDGKSRWEVRYPTAELLKAKEAAVRSGKLHLWMKEKECKVISEELVSFDLNDMRYWDQIPPGATFLITIDPASSDSPTADDNVVAVLAFYRGAVYLIEYEAATGQNPELVKKTVFEYIRRYRPIGIVVETVAYQRVLAWYLERALRKARLAVPIFKRQDKRRKADRIIQAIGGVLAYQRLYCKPSMLKFLEQMGEYTPRFEGHDDVIDAVSIGIDWYTDRGLDQDIEGECARVPDEDDYDDDEDMRRLSFRNAP